MNRSDDGKTSLWHPIARGFLLIAALTIVVPHVVRYLAQLPSGPSLSFQNVDSVIESALNDYVPPSKVDTVLWERHQSLCVALERISVDLDNRITKNRRYFDKDYVEQLTQDIDAHVAEFPDESLAIFGHYASRGETPMIRLLAMIAIRESFPKRNAVYYANKQLKSSHTSLVNISFRILSNTYNVTSLRDKFRPKYIEPFFVSGTINTS